MFLVGLLIVALALLPLLVAVTAAILAVHALGSMAVHALFPSPAPSVAVA
jgi:hypothetical protein